MELLCPTAAADGVVVPGNVTAPYGLAGRVPVMPEFWAEAGARQAHDKQKRRVKRLCHETLRRFVQKRCSARLVYTLTVAGNGRKGF